MKRILLKEFHRKPKIVLAFAYHPKVNKSFQQTIEEMCWMKKEIQLSPLELIHHLNSWKRTVTIDAPKKSLNHLLDKMEQTSVNEKRLVSVSTVKFSGLKQEKNVRGGKAWKGVSS